jgi:hypothetical protein
MGPYGSVADLLERSPMSRRSIYLRDEAAKCEWHAQNIGDDETQVTLRELAARYVTEANDIESKEQGGQHPLTFVDLPLNG